MTAGNIRSCVSLEFLTSKRIRKIDFAFLYQTDQSKIFRIMVRHSLPLKNHDLRDLGLICLVKKRKIRFRIPSDLRIQS